VQTISQRQYALNVSTTIKTQIVVENVFTMISKNRARKVREYSKMTNCLARGLKMIKYIKVSAINQ
jgi:hypothetical protein